MMKRQFLVLIFCLTALPAMAQLSANPWLEVNDEEDLEQVYKKESRRKSLSALKYQAEETLTIDRTDAYIQPEEIEDDKGLIDKVKDLVSGNKEEVKEPLPATSYNKQEVARKKAQRQAEKQAAASKKESDSLLPSFGFDKQIKGLKNKFKLPRLPSANGVIQKFEKASGINLKSIGNSLR